MSNPLSVIEQITYLLFIKRLDELQTLEESKATDTRQADGAAHLPGRQGRRSARTAASPIEDLRWSRFKNFEPREMIEIVDEHVFPFLRTLGGERLQLCAST